MKQHNLSRKQYRKKRIRLKLKRVSLRPRLSVFRSNKHIYSQIIDDNKGVTLVSVSQKDLPKDKTESGKKLAKAYTLGQILAKKALKKQIKKVYFDRGQNKYHGRIANLAKGAREGGLEF